ncbi:sulfotransferase family protein [Spirosoma litoris]
MHPLCNWIPYKLSLSDDAIKCQWLYTDELRFLEPFFDETISKCQSYPYNSGIMRAVSTLDGMIDMAKDVPYVPPTAFIFHVSRCGSTLLSQFLGLNEQHIILSEVPFLDELLRLNIPSISSDEQDQAFMAAIRLLGHKRTGAENRLFIKVDSWHVFYYETIRRLYPEVPIILLYRSPDEVVASHQKRRGMHAVPGLLPPALFGFDPADAITANFDDYTARVLERYLERFLTIVKQDDQAFLLNYQADGIAMMQQFLQFLNLPSDIVDWSLVQQRSSRHAKYPDQKFKEERLNKPIPDYLQPAMALYTQLNSVAPTEPRITHNIY